MGTPLDLRRGLCARQSKYCQQVPSWMRRPRWRARGANVGYRIRSDIAPDNPRRPGCNLLVRSSTKSRIGSSKSAGELDTARFSAARALCPLVKVAWRHEAMTTGNAPATADLRTLDIDQLMDLVGSKSARSGTASWNRPDGGTDTLKWFASAGKLRLTYVERLNLNLGEAQYSYDVPLARRRGSKRSWQFLCPQCKSHVQQLHYLLPGGGFFLCSGCQGIENAGNRRPGRPKTKRAYSRRKPFQVEGSSSETSAYCCRCRAVREATTIEEFIMANGRHAIRGRCAICGATVSRIRRDSEDHSQRSL